MCENDGSSSEATSHRTCGLPAFQWGSTSILPKTVLAGNGRGARDRQGAVHLAVAGPGRAGPPARAQSPHYDIEASELAELLLTEMIVILIGWRSDLLAAVQ